ncbi:MAG: hypothetical protein EOM35_02300 [Negativicutes bacterium]|nr:hypothetical protein [Negativicutes bacterium]
MGNHDNKHVIDIDADLIWETEDAYCVTTEEDTFEKQAKRIWVPKSLSEFDNGVLTVAEWFAVKVGLV